ncbi:MAG: hypothetical protein COA71_03385 [SAR86 cluster bacterium]|uniref:DUF2164 domain-containing protein n=1 Tax=SAR86 cluster bacterium TaxID=2030880 RepID=A0A2A5CGB3_9GAMM|nr:DUF2164 domain-containing protein [bacterium AH-315-I11]MBN4075851.1 DUF2164 domain-containing protein [Gammaproteobacteria bacterium AH-315-E17]PCJ42568.1 MAG: hypothetical protein COA71_03385 [SAR86 cluster bacterium]
MSEIEFSIEEKQALVQKIKSYFNNELGQDIGQFDAEFLLDFFSKEVGVHFYNLGLHDARDVFHTSMASIDEAIYVIEKDTTT